MNGAGKGPEPKPVDFKKRDKCPLWDNRKKERLKPGEKFTKKYK